MNKYEIAKQYFQNIRILIAGSCNYGVCQTGCFEVNVATEALEKQIPKKVVLGGYDGQDYVRCPQCKSEIAPMDDCYYYHCPGCGEKDAILQGDNYCFNCGQALDWSETK